MYARCERSSATGIRHPIFARVYARTSRSAEPRGQASARQRLLFGLQGRVVEAGAGNGLNFAHYPTTVDEVVAIEPESSLRRLARMEAARADVRVCVLDGTAEALPLEDASCDAAVASLLLCSVADQAVVLAELRRVLRPGGQLRFYEHVVSRRRALNVLQRAGDATIWPRLAGGCHAARDTEAAIKAAGFAISACERFDFSPSPIMPAVPHVLGIAGRG